MNLQGPYPRYIRLYLSFLPPLKGSDRKMRMKTETKLLVLLLILPPVMGELLSGSAPPLVFFNPVALVILILLLRRYRFDASTLAFEER